jgi:hypothetical protein
MITPVWNPGGIVNSHATGVRSDTSQQKWAIFNENGTGMPAADGEYNRPPEADEARIGYSARHNQRELTTDRKHILGDHVGPFGSSHHSP